MKQTLKRKLKYNNDIILNRLIKPNKQKESIQFGGGIEMRYKPTQEGLLKLLKSINNIKLPNIDNFNNYLKDIKLYN